jgi:hypothetical protein
MPANIEGWVCGNSVDITNDVPGISLSDPVLTAKLTIKTSPTDTDATAKLQKTISATPVVGVGQLTQDGSANNGNGTATVWFQLTKAETLMLGSAIRYYYDIRVYTVSGASFNPALDDTVYPPISVGSILLEDSVTDATS